jgi:signal transduction histidine kinase
MKLSNIIPKEKEREKIIQALIDQSVDGIAIFDKDGKFIEWNTGCEQITGLKHSNVIGKFVWDIHYDILEDGLGSAEDYSQIKESSMNMLKLDPFPNTGVIFEYKIRTKENLKKIVQNRLIKVVLEEDFLIGMIIRDITEQKKFEKQLMLQKEELSQFTYIMAHDLRNYLSTISGFAELLLNDGYNKEYCTRIIENVENTMSIFNRSLELANAGQIIDKKDSINLEEIVNAVSEVVLSDINFQTEPLPVIMGDREKLFQLFKNIFENALIHGKATNLEIKVTETKNKHKIHIINDGNAIDTKTRKMIIQGKTKGLGMIIIRKIIDAHGWIFKLESTKAPTTFSVIIPK